MAVIFPNTTLTARRKQHAYTRDAHGVPVAGAAWSDPSAPVTGALVEPPEGPTQNVPWKIRADVALWPISPDDEVTAEDGRVFIVRTARLVTVPGYDYVDHVQLTGELVPPYVP